MGVLCVSVAGGGPVCWRIDMKADRANGALVVKQAWLEPEYDWTQARVKKLEAELARMARFVGLKVGGALPLS